MPYTEEQLKKRREYYQKNKEKFLKRGREYYQKNKEKVKANNKQWRENNKEKVKETNKKWNEKNKEKIKEKKQEWIDKNKEYFTEYKKQYYLKNRETILKKREEYRSKDENKEKRKKYNRTEPAKKSYLISNWKHQGLKHTDEEIEIIYNRRKTTTNCDLCNILFDKKNKINMEHCHISGSFRNFTCHNCNMYRTKTDIIRMILIAELHRYFKLNDF